MQKFPKIPAICMICFALSGGSAIVIAQQPVVVELFTSEGCSSCPPADALLTSLSRQRTSAGGMELILLGEHVEYWNDLGWRDRFSASTYTQRQYDYVRHLHLATAYTPQVVIDGRLQTVGSDSAAVQRMIAESARSNKPATVNLTLVAPGKLHVKVVVSGSGKEQVLLAITEDNLNTTVQAGENGGRVLTHNAVVREFDPLGWVANGRFDKDVGLPGPRGWKPQDVRVVVLVQDAHSGVILGAASVPFESASPAAKGR